MDNLIHLDVPVPGIGRFTLRVACTETGLRMFKEAYARLRLAEGYGETIFDEPGDPTGIPKPLPAGQKYFPQGHEFFRLFNDRSNYNVIELSTKSNIRAESNFHEHLRWEGFLAKIPGKAFYGYYGMIGIVQISNLKLLEN